MAGRWSDRGWTAGARPSAGLQAICRGPGGRRARLLGVSLAAATALLAAACSEPLVFEDWTIPVPEGATVIGHQHVPIVERTERIELVEDLLIGGDGDPNAEFYQVVDIAVDEDGTMYVLERGNHRVQVFDAQGGYLRTLGSEGQGPGEIQEAFNVTIAGDAVVVVDPANARLNYWATADGEFLGSEELAERSLEIDGLDDGNLVGRHVIFHREPEFYRELSFGLYSRVGEELQRYLIFRALPSVTITIPFSTERLAVTPEGDVYITQADRYQVLAFDAEGAPRWALRSTFPSPPIPEEIFESALAGLRENQPDYERPDDWPERMPGIGNMVLDGDGNIYVFPYVYRRFGPRGQVLEEPPDEYAVDVYAPDGSLLSAAVIDRMGWTTARGDYVYSMGRDPETEEEVLRRYRLVLPWEQ